MSDNKSQVTENDLELHVGADEKQKKEAVVKSKSPDQETANQNGENTDEVI